MGMRLEDARTGRPFRVRSPRRGSDGNVSEAQAWALRMARGVRGRLVQCPVDLGWSTARALKRKGLLLSVGGSDGLYVLTEAGRIVGRLVAELEGRD